MSQTMGSMVMGAMLALLIVALVAVLVGAFVLELRRRQPSPPPSPPVVVAAEGRVVVSVGVSDRVGVLPPVDVRQVEPRELSGRMGA